jgi:RNA polymerase sigma-70 factor (ECF subfamily)
VRQPGEDKKRTDARRNRLDGRAPSSLLYTTATNICPNMIRDRQRKREIPREDEHERAGSETSWESRLLTDHFLERVFGEEADSTRTMAYLHYVDSLTLEETAELTGRGVPFSPRTGLFPFSPLRHSRL